MVETIKEELEGNYHSYPFIPFFNMFNWPLVGGLGFVLWVVLMYKAYQGVMYKLPVAGDLADKWSTKTTK